jgi:hypothetical protein
MSDTPDPPTPTLADGTPMKRFQVAMRMGSNGTFEKAIFIGGELLDWSVDISSFMEARKMAKDLNNPAILIEVQKDIARHFLEAVSDTIGRKVTEEDIKTATKTGWI